MASTPTNETELQNAGVPTEDPQQQEGGGGDEDGEDEDEHGNSALDVKKNQKEPNKYLEILRYIFEIHIRHQYHKIPERRLNCFQIYQKRLAKVLESIPVQVVVILLITLDIAIALAQVVMALTDQSSTPNPNNTVISSVLSIVSLVILSCYLTEITFKIIAFDVRFFFKFWLILDASVVVASIILEFVLREVTTKSVTNLLIFIRVWRAVRIIFGIARAVSVQKNRQIRRLKFEKDKLTKQVEQYKTALDTEKGKVKALMDDFAELEKYIDTESQMTGAKLKKRIQTIRTALNENNALMKEFAAQL